jgi:DNA sulfur modification protein DndB
MANKTIIPAFKAKVGNWDYFICIMKYAEVARHIHFSYELRASRDLSEIVQRGLSKRAADITSYLLESEHRFLGAMLVAVWGGHPTYQPLSMEDSDGILAGIDRQFGVVTFDGGQQYFALDGQHRLKSIQDALKRNPDLGSEEICVIMVPHLDTEEGRRATRRLFTNINRNAKSTTLSENIALDEDDGAAIITRRLISEHKILSKDGVVRIFSKEPNEEGEMKLAGLNINITDGKALTTIGVLYDLVKSLSFGLPKEIRATSARPSADLIEEAYSVITTRIDQLLDCYDPLIKRLITNGEHARSLRAPQGAEGEGHPFMRPVIQRSICRVLGLLCDQQPQVVTYESALSVLKSLPATIKSNPWSAVFNTQKNSMITSKENVNLLDRLLRVHIAPNSKADIAQTRKLYKEIRAENYGFSEELMLKKVRGDGIEIKDLDEKMESMADKLDSGT